MMLSRRKSAAPETAVDFSASLSRALRKPTIHREDGETGRAAGPAIQAIEALEATLDVLNQAGGAVRDAARHVIAAASQPDVAARALLAERYDDARAQVERLAQAAPEAAHILVAPMAERLSVPLQGATYAISPFPLTLEEQGLDLPPPNDGFETHAEIAETLRRVETAIERIGRASVVYAKDRAFLQRQAR
ncbi:hypothetical protein [Parvularcula dongshanensis]|uniref:Uncharacterized protein n=1 Tax=Parvularcula dongshanensis TaxID=1173995 RepID=A0A840I1A7_9PROT|nr:hypothetical protein [Parvularcula dongshanensis]MBB4657870.1 hypothetical protein [Parvularcula dongshanensis]